ncbi:hypothetical protein Syun_018994 [Stephania yunnanensis]|uniref:Uncharacterized protein n=1 Tax=Stephania yunnanensis TaxID=152371 RepID=A0AAP0IT96_9MAGN
MSLLSALSPIPALCYLSAHRPIHRSLASARCVAHRSHHRPLDLSRAYADLSFVLSLSRLSHRSPKLPVLGRGCGVEFWPMPKSVKHGKRVCFSIKILRLIPRGAILSSILEWVWCLEYWGFWGSLIYVQCGLFDVGLWNLERILDGFSEGSLLSMHTKFDSFKDRILVLRIVLSCVAKCGVQELLKQFVNLTMIDLPGLTKVAVGKFYCFAIVGMLKSEANLDSISQEIENMVRSFIEKVYTLCIALKGILAFTAFCVGHSPATSAGEPSDVLTGSAPISTRPHIRDQSGSKSTPAPTTEPPSSSEPMASTLIYICASDAFYFRFFTKDAAKIYDALEESKFHYEQRLDEKTYKHHKVYQFLEARGFRDNLDINDVTSTLTSDRVQEVQWGARLTTFDLTALYFTLFIHVTHNLFLIWHDANVLPEDYLFLYAIGQGIIVNYRHMLFKDICLHAHNRKYWKKLSLPCLITALLATEEVFTVPLDVIVEAPVRTIHSIILKASSYHLVDLPVSTALLESVKYHSEALIFPPETSLTPPTSPSVTMGTSDHSFHVPLLMMDD